MEEEKQAELIGGVLNLKFLKNLTSDKLVLSKGLLFFPKSLVRMLNLEIGTKIGIAINKEDKENNYIYMVLLETGEFTVARHGKLTEVISINKVLRNLNNPLRNGKLPYEPFVDGEYSGIKIKIKEDE